MSKITLSYFAIHKWLRRHYGTASHCENRCRGKYEWALIKGKKHEKNIKNYKPLCVKCHRNYDKKFGKDTPMFGKKHKKISLIKMSLARKGVPKSLEHRRKIGESQIGKLISKKHREKLRKYRLGRKASIETKRKMSLSQRRRFNK
jgi:hypothetical protein